MSARGCIIITGVVGEGLWRREGARAGAGEVGGEGEGKEGGGELVFGTQE